VTNGAASLGYTLTGAWPAQQGTTL
jgi:hypothetical protein